MKFNMCWFGYVLFIDFKGIERNLDFVVVVIEVVGGDKMKQVIVYCFIGGILQIFVECKGLKVKKYNDLERFFGCQFWFFKVIYELQEVGFINVVYMKEGLNQWRYLDFFFEVME